MKLILYVFLNVHAYMLVWSDRANKPILLARDASDGEPQPENVHALRQTSCWLVDQSTRGLQSEKWEKTHFQVYIWNKINNNSLN